MNLQFAMTVLLQQCKGLIGLATSPSHGKKGRRNKTERDLSNIWQPGSLAGQDSVQSASFYKNQYPIICIERTMIQQSEALRCSLTMADSSFNETVVNNPVIF